MQLEEETIKTRLSHVIGRLKRVKVPTVRKKKLLEDKCLIKDLKLKYLINS